MKAPSAATTRDDDRRPRHRVDERLARRVRDSAPSCRRPGRRRRATRERPRRRARGRRRGAVGELRRVERRHDAPDDGDAERAAELARRVVDGGPDVRPLGRERAHDRLGRRSAREAHARAHEQQRDGEPAVAGARGDRRRDGETGREEQHPRGDDALGAEARDELRGERREHDHRSGVGQDAHAGGRRRVAEDELQVLRRQEEEPEEGEEQHHDRAAGRGEARVREQADVEQRLLDAALPHHERDQRDRGERTGGEHRGGRPALRRAPR